MVNRYEDIITIMFMLKKPKSWGRTSFENLLCDILDNCGADEYQYDRRIEEPAIIVFKTESEQEGRRILTEFSHLNANQWKMQCRINRSCKR